MNRSRKKFKYFANDVVILAQNKQNLAFILRILIEVTEYARLKLNDNNFKSMRITRDRNDTGDNDQRIETRSYIFENFNYYSTQV